MFLLIITTWLLVAVDSKTISRNDHQCTGDLASTCQNITQAVHCETFKKCLKSVWTENVLFDSTQEGCEPSMASVKKLRQMTHQKEEEPDVRVAFSKLCTSFSSNLQRECRHTINTYMPYIMHMMRHDHLPTENILPILGICKSEETLECTVCKLLADKLKSIDRDKQLQIDFQEYYNESVCAGFGELGGACMALVMQHAEQIFRIMTGEADSRALCVSQRLCIRPQYMTSPIRNTYPVQTDDTMECATCRILAKKIRDMEYNVKIDTDIKAFLEDNVCTKLGPLSVGCSELVDEHGLALFDTMATLLDTETICKTIRVCGPGENLQPIVATEQDSQTRMDASSPSTKDETMECEVCQLLIGELQKMDKNVEFEHHLERHLNRTVCVTFGPLDRLCADMVDEHAMAFFKLMSKELDPVNLCVRSKVCTQLNNYNTAEEKRPPVTIHQSSAIATSQCALCEFVMSKFSVLLKKSTKDAAKAALNKVCETMPNTLRVECGAFVEYYSVVIQSLTERNTHPEQICQLVNVCGKTSNLPVPRPRTTTANKYSDKLGEVSCDICLTVFDYLIDVLLDDTTLQDIDKDFEEVCKFVPEEIRAECKVVVVDDAKVIVKMLTDDTDPLRICKKIDMCGEETRKESTAYTSIAHLKDVNCDFCIEMFRFLEDVLVESKTELVVESEMDAFCHFFTPDIRPSCMSAFKKFVPRLIGAMVEESNDLAICQKAEWCPTVTQQTSKPIAQVIDRTIERYSSDGGHEACDLCKTMMAFLVQILGETSTAEEIENALKMLCNVMPSTFRDECDMVVKEYASQLVGLIVHLADPDKICEAIDLCRTNNLETHGERLLGANQCEQGPSFWCGSQANAELCNAEKYCRSHDWREN